MRSRHQASPDEDSENKTAQDRKAERGENSPGDLRPEWVGTIGSKRAPKPKQHESQCDYEEQQVGPGKIAGDGKPHKQERVAEKRKQA